MGCDSGSREAEFLYRNSKTFYFSVEDEVYGFVPDCGITPDSFVRVLESASSGGKLPVQFLVRNTVMTSRPKNFKTGSLLNESFSRLKEDDEGAQETPVTSARNFLLGYRLGYDRGYNTANTEFDE